MLATMRPDTRLWIKFYSQIFVIAALFACAGATAEPVAFGTRTLNVPAPEGFVGVAKSSPQYIQAMQAYLPASNRLVDAFVTPESAKALIGKTTIALDRYFQLQTLRKVDGTALSSEDFRGASTEIETSFAKAIKEVDIGKLTKDGNAQVKKMTSADPQVALSGVESQGVYRREPWGIFFTVKSRVASGASGESVDLICAGAVTLVNHQLMYLNGYALLNGPDDQKWVQQAVSAWADMVHAANPDDPEVAAKAQSIGSGGFNWTELRNTTLIGAGIGAFIGLILAFVRRRKQ